MRTTTAPKKTNRNTHPSTTASKGEPTLLDLADLIARVADGGTVWQKASPFDHDHWACTSYTILMDLPGGAKAIHLQTYNGQVSAKQAPALNLEGGVPVADVAKYLAALERKGYRLATPNPASRKGRRKAK